MEPVSASEATLADVLGERARHTSRSRLLLDAGGGVLVAVAALWARPPGWALLATVACCVACYGLWAFAERRLRPVAGVPRADDRLWGAIWRVTATLGVLAFVLMLLLFLGLALGRLIS